MSSYFVKLLDTEEWLPFGIYGGRVGRSLPGRRGSPQGYSVFPTRSSRSFRFDTRRRPAQLCEQHFWLIRFRWNGFLQTLHSIGFDFGPMRWTRSLRAHIR